MSAMSLLRIGLKVLGVLALDTCLAQFAWAQNTPTSGKTFAVFVAAYNPATGQARGGVAGTAFFVSSYKALTAYHVLQPASFKIPKGFSQIHVWLVHEGEAAIELSSESISPRPDLDLTLISLKSPQRVAEKYVFKTVQPGDRIEHDVKTEGFLANSTGPKLQADPSGHLAITAVPILQRIYASGNILQSNNVSIRSIDVNLSNSPCYKLSYQPVVGLSGGPVSAGGRVIAINSFADPSTRAQTWAIDLGHQVDGVF
jgi:hypothetical protein